MHLHWASDGIPREYLLTARCNCLQVYGSKLKQAEEGTVKLVALDCGSGVGRIAQDMLLHFCAEVCVLKTDTPSCTGAFVSDCYMLHL